MKLPAESSSSWVHIGYASFTWASLNAWSEFPDLSPADRAILSQTSSALKASIDSLLKESRATQDQQLFGQPVARAKQNAALSLLRRRVSEALSFLSIRVAGGAKGHPAVREFLPNLQATVTGARIAARPGVVAQAAERLAGLAQDFDEKPVLVQKLRDAATLAQTAVNSSDDATAAWTRERSEEVVAKGRLRLELERAHRSLGAHFAGQRDFVESFFLKGERPSEGTAEEPATPVEAPA